MTAQKTILIMGCSTGIGYMCAHGMKARDWRVFATARNETDLKRLNQADRKDVTNKFKLRPVAVLAKLLKAIELPNPKAHFYVTTPTYIMAAVRRFLPHRLSDYVANRFSES